ncbi:hypothetical protein B0H16DRAFT_1733434 [Mycena metata]|uniref:Uncharacterized protein n=1 Tax=Mycena metata TaxID=1033252 RepID=A0AAD7MUB3_9AGAR|nr:hypothetical protein B0H16DRAFT_1733434 [Mycena metata]
MLFYPSAVLARIIWPLFVVNALGTCTASHACVVLFISRALALPLAPARSACSRPLRLLPPRCPSLRATVPPFSSTTIPALLPIAFAPVAPAQLLPPLPPACPRPLAPAPVRLPRRSWHLSTTP